MRYVTTKLYAPFWRYFRSKRLRLLYNLFPIGSSTKVLDVGGAPYFWELVNQLKLPFPDVTILNLHGPGKQPSAQLKWVIADGTRLPFHDQSFDLIFCNSVIEHAGDWNSQILFAEEIRRVGRRYFVQTPARNFPVEPHLLAPFVHWFPRKIQEKLVPYVTGWGLITRPNQKEVQLFLDHIRLLNQKEMIHLFPDAEMVVERFFFVPKSLIATRTWNV
jgi:hypothetical protein